ncbi:hypothetical protein F2P79_004424 [Pimephales promelas]|nr:hypothetical protein F2P79_004424 [Pimephales promelas]
MSSQSASSSVGTGVPLYSVVNSRQYHLSSHQTDSRSSCSPCMFMMKDSSYVYAISGGCCSLQPKDQTVPVLESESESM